MDTKTCEYILEIARQKSITRAAETLGVSQSALSQSLLRVEKELGAQLFTRKKSALSPTEAGKLYLDTAGKMVLMNRRLVTDISTMNRRKRIYMGVTSMWGMEMMIELIPVFRERFPEVMLELQNGNFQSLATDYQMGRLDVLVTSAVSENILPGTEFLLRREGLRLIISSRHPFAQRHWNQQTLPREAIRRELAQEDTIRHDRGSTNYLIENALFEELGMQTRTICQLGDYASLRRLVGSGLGYAIVSGDVVDVDQRIRSWELEPKLERANLLLVHPDVVVGSAEEYLIEIIRNYRLFQ